jgi:hypothetical protein
VLCLEVDLAKDECLEQILPEYQGLEIGLIIPNSGSKIPGAFAECDLEEEKRMFRLNGLAPLARTRPHHHRLTQSLHRRPLIPWIGAANHAHRVTTPEVTHRNDPQPQSLTTVFPISQSTFSPAQLKILPVRREDSHENKSNIRDPRSKSLAVPKIEDTPLAGFHTQIRVGKSELLKGH